MHALLKTTNEAPISIERTLRLAGQVNPVLGNECRRRLRYMHMQSFDWEQGGLLSPIKFIDRDSVEYSLVIAAEQDRNEERMARLTLDNALALVDPVWGGVYQYSTQGKWNVPHYRKTIATQAGHLRLYSLAYAQLKLNRYLDVTNTIQSYIKTFMTDDSDAFYAGQSDTVAGISPMRYFSLDHINRKIIGTPEVDQRILSRENGWMIEALATHYEYCGSQLSLEMAKKAALWINKYCRTQEGGYLSNKMTDTPVNLADTLAMARALLQLYRCTFNSNYLELACQSADFIDQHFRNRVCGYNSRIISDSVSSSPRQMDENIALARFTNLLSYYKPEPRFRNIAKHGLRHLCIPEIATARMEEAGILLLDHEMLSSPLTINIHGSQNHPLFNEFKNIAHRHPGWYKLIKYFPSKLVYASVEIDGFKSRTLTTTKKLVELLENY